jgi:hypothetical protein
MKSKIVAEVIFGPAPIAFLKFLSDSERKRAFIIISSWLDDEKLTSWVDGRNVSFTPDDVERGFEKHIDDDDPEYFAWDGFEADDGDPFAYDLSWCWGIENILDNLDADDGYIYSYTTSDRDYGWVTVIRSLVGER